MVLLVYNVYFRPILTEFKTTKEFEKRRSRADVFFVFVQDDSEKSHEYKVCDYIQIVCLSSNAHDSSIH